MRALIIDDSRAMRMILKKILCEFGFEVAEAADGQEGLHRIEEASNFDVITVDWDMPIMDGLSFVRAVRSDFSQHGPPMIMVTTKNNLQEVADALRAGADEYIMKPFTEDVLREKLQLMGCLSGARDEQDQSAHC